MSNFSLERVLFDETSLYLVISGTFAELNGQGLPASYVSFVPTSNPSQTGPRLYPLRRVLEAEGPNIGTPVTMDGSPVFQVLLEREFVAGSNPPTLILDAVRRVAFKVELDEVNGSIHRTAGKVWSPLRCPNVGFTTEVERCEQMGNVRKRQVVIKAFVNNRPGSQHASGDFYGTIKGRVVSFDPPAAEDQAFEPMQSYGATSTFEIADVQRPGLHESDRRILRLDHGMKYRLAAILDAPSQCQNNSDRKLENENDVVPPDEEIRELLVPHCECPPRTPGALERASGGGFANIDTPQECVSGPSVTLQVPRAHSGMRPITWTKEPPDSPTTVTPTAGDVTAATVTNLPASGDVTVIARVGPSDCPLTFRRTLKRCPQNPPPGSATGSGTESSDPASDQPRFPRITPCCLLECLWMLLLLLGLIAFVAAAFVAIGLGPPLLALAAEGPASGYALIPLGILIKFVELIYANGALLQSLALAVFLLWLLICRPSRCRVLQDIDWLLYWNRTLVVLLAALIFSVRLENGGSAQPQSDISNVQLAALILLFLIAHGVYLLVNALLRSLGCKELSRTRFPCCRG